MKLLEKLTKKVASTASIAVTDSVKAEAKNAVVAAAPVVLSVGAIFAGLWIFKSAGGSKAVTNAVAPTISHVTTNNYFFDSAVKADVIAKLIEK